MAEGMTNGFRLRSWSDLSSLLLIITFIISGLVWGMKLEARYDKLETNQQIIIQRLGSHQGRLDVGILPRAEERIDSIEKRLRSLENGWAK